MFQRKSLILLVLAMVFALSLSSCNKDNGPGSASSGAVYDSSETAKPVTMEEKDHRIMFLPKVGEVYRYRVTITNVASAQSQDDLLNQLPPIQNVKGVTVYYLKQTIRQIRPDSTVDVSVHFDSIATSVVQDTTKAEFSSTRDKDKNDPRFAQTAILGGQDFGMIVTRNGDVIEMYGTSNLVARYMATLPDSLKSVQMQNYINGQVQTLIKSYVGRTLTHFPAKTLAKDTTWGASGAQNINVFNTLFQGFITSTEKIAGFEERGGKRLAVFDATSSVKPTQNVIEQDPLKATLANYTGTTHAVSNVEDATGVLVYRSVMTKLGYDFTIESKKMPGKRLHSVQTSNENAVTELLK